MFLLRRHGLKCLILLIVMAAVARLRAADNHMSADGAVRVIDSQKILFVEFSFYFSGSALKHQEVELPNLSDPKNRRVITRAVAPRDRLVSVMAATAGGILQTPPIQFAGDRLVVNAIARPGGRVRVGLLDAQGTSIPGRGVKDCQALTNDSFSWTVSWSDGPDVAAWSGKPVRLRIELADADVFGFQFHISVRRKEGLTYVSLL